MSAPWRFPGPTYRLLPRTNSERFRHLPPRRLGLRFAAPPPPRAPIFRGRLFALRGASTKRLSQAPGRVCPAPPAATTPQNRVPSARSQNRVPRRNRVPARAAVNQAQKQAQNAGREAIRVRAAQRRAFHARVLTASRATAAHRPRITRQREVWNARQGATRQSQNATRHCRNAGPIAPRRQSRSRSRSCRTCRAARAAAAHLAHFLKNARQNILRKRMIFRAA